jgi:hypothetical protein
MTTKRILFLCWFSLLLGTMFVHAQTTTVKVVVDNPVGFGYRQYAVVGFDDYISLTPKFLADTFDFENQVSMQFSLNGPRWVRVQGPGVNTDIIAVPGSTYHFKINQEESGSFLDREAKAGQKNDINQLSDSVNILVNSYLYKYNTQLYSGAMAKQTSKFCDSLELAFSRRSDALFQTFLSFRLDELRILSRAWSELAMFNSRFLGKPFQPENPDYAYAFGEFYKGRLSQIFLKNKMSHGKQLINNFRGYDTLANLLSAEKYYPKSEVGEGAFLFGLTELLNDKNYSSDGILYLFNQISDSSDYVSVKTLAARLYKKYKIPVSGDVAPRFSVKDKSDNDMTIDPKRATYVCFFDPKSAVTAEELVAMIEMKKKLKEKVVLLPVIINAQKAEMNRLQASLRLTFDLYRSVGMAILSDFRLKNDCSCMVISPDGKYLLPNAPLPSAPLASDKLLELSKTVR